MSRALPATELRSPSLLAGARRAETAPANTSKHASERHQQGRPSSRGWGTPGTRHLPLPRSRQAGYSQVTPKFFPKMPPQRAALVGGPAAPPLFTFFLGRGQRVGPAGESPEGGLGGWDQSIPEGREGAKELGACGVSPPNSAAQVKPPRGHLCQGTREPTSSFITSQPRPSPRWLSTHPPGGRERKRRNRRGGSRAARPPRGRAASGSPSHPKGPAGIPSPGQGQRWHCLPHFGGRPV